jgi:hypothetical protein
MRPSARESATATPASAVAPCDCARRTPMRRHAEAAAKAAGIALQLAAPKCAICWTTYAGLLNASWFSVTSANPKWLALSMLSITLALMLAIRTAWRTQRSTPLACAAAAWLLVVAGWLSDMAPLKYAGLALLLAPHIASVSWRSACSKANPG